MRTTMLLTLEINSDNITKVFINIEIYQTFSKYDN